LPNPEGIIAIACAIPMEAAGLVRAGGFGKIAGGCDIGAAGSGEITGCGVGYYRGVVHGMDVALFISGIGEQRAYETARTACGFLPLRAYISAGLSGALTEGLKPGDVVAGTKTASGGREYHSERGLADAALEAFGGDGHVRFGNLYAASRVLARADEKKALSLACGCAAVDMESAGAARAAQEAGVPFIAIRAISDSLDEDLPVDFNRFTKDGRLDYPRLIMHIITHPGTIGPLVRLGRNSQLAADNLANALLRLCATIHNTNRQTI